MKTLEELQAEKNELHSQMDTAKFILNRELWIKEINEISKQITELRIQQQLKNVNGEQARKRDAAKLAWEAEQPTEDITTADGSLHKVKAKKYPKLAAIPYVRITFKDGLTTELNINGNRFSMFKSKYEYNKPTEYTRSGTFAEFLELNSIQTEDITPEQFAKFSSDLDAANEELKKAIAAYDLQRKKINVSQMQYIGLVNQNNSHLYIYEAKKGY